jgi:hypothetical protein
MKLFALEAFFNARFISSESLVIPVACAHCVWIFYQPHGLSWTGNPHRVLLYDRHKNTWGFKLIFIVLSFDFLLIWLLFMTFHIIIAGFWILKNRYDNFWIFQTQKLPFCPCQLNFFFFCTVRLVMEWMNAMHMYVGINTCGCESFHTSLKLFFLFSRRDVSFKSSLKIFLLHFMHAYWMKSLIYFFLHI